MLNKAEWEQAQQRLTMAWHKGDLSKAFAEIDRVLVEGTTDMKAQSLLYRGMIKDDQRDYAGAEQAWQEALSHATKGSYTRYVAERSLGDVSEKLGKLDQAVDWFRAALRTCTEGGSFSGGQALKGFLALKARHGQQLSSDDQALAVSVAQQSWNVMELPGTPDLADLNKTAELLAKKATEP